MSFILCFYIFCTSGCFENSTKDLFDVVFYFTTATFQHVIVKIKAVLETVFRSFYFLLFVVSTFDDDNYQHLRSLVPE